jgi:aspartyl-tRNA(Asn)/glutamyl-tRNA(Gln) amidotransferase subunit A
MMMTNTSMTTDPALMTAGDLAERYRRHDLSPVEVVTAVFERIRRLDTRTNAFCHLDPEGALAAARAAEARYAKGEALSPVDGVPATIKDLILVKGWPTLRGSTLIDRDQAWAEDSPATARLREAGAILVGKTTTPEFGWKAVTDSVLTGITRNPWNLERTPGGSSGGAAVAAALGFGALHLGTDGGGSIRVPAAFTGVFGLKPSFSRVPAWPASPFAAVSHLGPITRSVADAAAMLNVIAQPDLRDGLALPPSGCDWLAELEAGVQGWRVGFAATINDEAVDPGVAATVEAAARLFERLGARLEPIELALPASGKLFRMLWQTGAAVLLDGFPEERRQAADAGLRAMAEAGRHYSATDYVTGLKQREALALIMDQLLERVDLILTPSVPIIGFGAGLNAPANGPYAGWTGWTPFSNPFNLTRHPAASMPCGFVQGMPVGLQLVGPRFRDDVVLRAARALETILPIALPALE